MLFQITYEPEKNRLALNGRDIHCGQCLEVLMPNTKDGGTLCTTRVEYSDRWYFVGMKDVSPVGIWAKETD